jgi:hypothetical protein
MSLATKIHVLGAVTLSIALADSLTVVNPNFANVAVQCAGAGYAYQAVMAGNCAGPTVPQQNFNVGLGIGWTFEVGTVTGGDGVTTPNTDFNPPPFTGLPFSQAALLQGTVSATIGQEITGFVPGGTYALSFYAGSRYASAGTYDGNQTVQVMLGGQALGTWNLVSFTPFTLETANFTAVDGGSNILKFQGIVSGDHTAFFSGVSIETVSSLTVSPATGVPGIGVAASASGFTPFETVNLIAYASAPATIGTTTANASGVVNLEGHLPQTPFGACGLQAVGQSSDTVASGIISVRPFLSVSPSSGAVGQTVTVTGFGFAAGEEVGLAWPNPPTSLGSATANKNGTFSAQFAIPSGAPAGTDDVVARGQRTGAVAAAQIAVQ